MGEERNRGQTLSMIRLHVVAEGQAEEAFVNSILAIHLGSFDISTDVRCVETSRTRMRIYRGGVTKYPKIKRDLQLWMKEDDNADSYFTTMFDLYGLGDDFPGWEAAKKAPKHYPRVAILERAFADDLAHRRFIPYIQLHEFESLLLADPTQFGIRFLNQEAAIQRLAEMVAKVDSPELLNDGPTTAPSKRIIKEIPEYEGTKASSAPLIAEKIGVSNLRKKCPHFHEWLSKVEALGTPPPATVEHR
jgi:hypothetical protein